MTLNRLQSCEKPLIYFGGGIISSGAEAELLALAEAQDIPVCSSMMGLGGFPPDHRLWLGMVGMHGTLAATARPGSAICSWPAVPGFPTG